MRAIRRLALLSLLAPAALQAAPAAPAVPLLLPVQGRLLDQEDRPVSGQHRVTYQLFARAEPPPASSGESEQPLWTETVTVTLFNGTYSALLGLDHALPAGAFEGDRYLAIKLDDGADLQPRLRVGSVPYALTAARAHTALSLDAQACQGCVKGSMLGEGEISAAKLAPGTALQNLAPASIPADKLAPGAAIANVEAGSIGADKLAGGIGADKLAEGAAIANLAAGSIGADKLAEGAALGNLSAASVTADKLAQGAALGNLAAASITGDKLAPGAALASLADGSIPLSKIAGYNATSGQILGLDAATLGARPASDYLLKGSAVQLTSASQAPATCDQNTRGLLYFNTTDGFFYGCNGTRFLRLTATVPLDGSTKDSANRTCKTIKDQGLSRGDGVYWIDANGGDTADAIQAWCDMTTDGGGYTMVRFNDPALLGNQDTYAAKCAAVGMEVVVPRTKAHALALKAWNNNTVPNLVNVFPKANASVGLQNWTGKCQGANCTFWVSDTNNANCTGNEPNGDNSTPYRLYRLADGCDYGAWNDANNSVTITGWVICSPNDK